MLLYRKRGFYEKYIKRILDIICALLAIIFFSWLYLIIAVLVLIKLGNPVIFKQPRPGMIDPQNGRESIFDMYKFRTMTNERNINGKLLPDEERIGKFGKMLRATSLDELPEAFNILRGDMSLIGPRPQLVRDMIFMNDRQRMRHTAKPGLSGLAQVMGRNAITWEEKLEWDLKYIDNVTFFTDLKLVWLTFKKVFIRNNIVENSSEVDLTADFGDYLLQCGKISNKKYEKLQVQARKLISEHNKQN